MEQITIRDQNGSTLDAKVEVGGGEIVVHSRSGAGASARNPDYRPALEAILTRLTEQKIEAEIFLDSRPVQHLPLPQRRIASTQQLAGPIKDQFNILIRAMNAGSNSHGAWRRILFKTASRPARELFEIIATPTTKHSNEPIERLSNREQRLVTASHVENAITRLLAGEDAPNFANSRDYDLVTETGERLAPKKVFGLAIEEALGIQAYPGHFSAGWSQPCFQILQDSGYSIVRKSASLTAKDTVLTEVASLPLNPEERSWAEGDIRIITHLRRERTRDPKAAQAKRTAVRQANDGRLSCEHCNNDLYAVYPPEIAEGIFDIHHTIPLADMSEDHETALEDLLCLCANCHRAEHRRMALC